MRSPLAGAVAGVLLVLIPLAARAQGAPGGGDRERGRPAAAADAGAAATADAEPISLAQVLQHAVRHSPELASARIDVTVAEARVLEAMGIEDWLLGMTGSYYRRRSDAAEGNIIGTNEVDRFIASASISKLLWTGGTFSLQADTDRNITLFAFGGGERTTEVNTSVTARISQPLFRGRGEGVTRAARNQAELLRQAAELQREAAARALVRDLVAAYWELAFAAADLEIRRSSAELARERRRLTEASVRAGATAPTEVVATDQVIASRDEDIVVAELGVLQRALAMRAMAGLEIGPGHLGLNPTAPLEVEPAAIELDDVLARAMENSPEIAALQARGESAEIEVEVTDNGLLPALDFSLYGGPLGTASSFTGSVDQMVTGGGYEVGAELRLQHAFGRRSARGSHRRAMAERERVRVDMNEVRLQLASAAAEAVAQARAAERRLTLSRTAIELSEKNIQAEIGRFELGKATNFDVLQRQEELTQARLRYARAVTDYLRATTFIAALTGEILPANGIEFE